MTDDERGRKWRDPLPVSTSSLYNRTPLKTPRPTGPKCKGCKEGTASEEYAPFCSSYCQRSWEACKGAAK